MKNLKIKKNNIGKNNPRFLDNQIREKKCAHCHRTMSWWVEFRHLPISIFVKKICCSYQCSNTLNKLIENRKDKNKKNRIKKCEGCGKEMDWSVGYRKKAISEFIKMKFCTKKCADKNGLRYIGKDHPNFRKFSRRKLPQKKRSVWFRREVLKRDKNVCQKCLKKESYEGFIKVLDKNLKKMGAISIIPFFNKDLKKAFKSFELLYMQYEADMHKQNKI